LPLQWISALVRAKDRAEKARAQNDLKTIEHNQSEQMAAKRPSISYRWHVGAADLPEMKRSEMVLPDWQGEPPDFPSCLAQRGWREGCL
jgi:hypothetical protein